MMVRSCSTYLLILLASFAFNAIPSSSDQISPRNYRGYQVFRVIPRDAVQLQHLRSIEEQIVYTPPFDVDFWRLSGDINEPSELMLNSAASEYILNGIQGLGMTPEIIVRDLEG